MLRKIKHAVDEKLCKRLYPMSSKLGSFYGTDKVHKFKEREGIDKLTLKSIISNIGTARYEITRYLAELLAPLRKYKHGISITKYFITRLKTERIPKRFKIISFDVKSFFANVPLEDTIDIIFTKIYDEKKVETNIPRNIMKDLLYLCTKRVHFTYLGPLLTNIFTISLEEAILPSIKKHEARWKRYVDNTNAYIDPSKIEFFLEKLNSYHPNIQFTFEIEENQKIKFLETTVFRKETNTDLYINWNSDALIHGNGND